jgi:CBS domain-containing protein
MKVHDIMTRDPKTAQLDSTLEEIAALMKDEDVGAIPIVDDDDELVGIVTDRDIVVRCVAEGKEASDTTVEDILSEDLTTVEPDADVQQAARLMADKQIRRLPVVRDRELLGMISIGDISVKQDDETAGETLQQISKGVREEGRGKKPRAASEREDRSRANRQTGGTRAENAVAREFEDNEDFDLEFSDEEEDAIPAARGNEGRQAGTSKSARGRHQGSVRGRDTSISRRQPNPGTLPSAKDQYNARNTSAESQRNQSESKSGTRSKQGIANRRIDEENRRQARVISIRDDAKAGSSKRAANRRKTGS